MIRQSKDSHPPSLLCSDCCLSQIAKHGQGSVFHFSPFPPLIDTDSRCCRFLLSTVQTMSALSLPTQVKP